MCARRAMYFNHTQSGRHGPARAQVRSPRVRSRLPHRRRI
jgi:hypothetical protein